MKRQFRILLISLFSMKGHHYARTAVGRPVMPSLGPLSIASFVKQKPWVDVRVIDFAVDRLSLGEFKRHLESYDPHLIGFSIYAETHDAAMQSARLCRSVVPRAKTIFGGAQATFAARDILQDEAADFVCMGEGEATTMELVEALRDGERRSFGGIRGLAWKDESGEILCNPPREAIRHLDELPFPDRELTRGKGYVEAFTLITGRGCTGKCKFCCSQAFWGKGVRVRSAENVFSELRYLREQGSRLGIRDDDFLCIVDDSFTLAPARVKRFCALLLDAPFRLAWQCSSRLDVLDEDLLACMYAAGCRHIQIGVESINQDIVAAAGKNIDVTRLEDVLRTGRKIGLDISLGFIIGFPEDTRESIRDNVNEAKRLWQTYGLDTVTLTFNTPYPGTEYYERAAAYGLQWNARRWSQYSMQNPLVRTGNFAAEDLAAAFNDFSTFASRCRAAQFRPAARIGG